MKKMALLLIALISTQFVNTDVAQAACTSSRTSGSVKVGSSISSGSVVVCASSSTAKSTNAVKTSSTGTSSVRRVVTPVRPVVAPCIIKVSSTAAINDPRVPGCTYQVVAPVKTSVLATKTSPVAASTSSVQSDQAAFTPNQIGISSSPSSGMVGQAFFFTAVAGAHTRSGTILGQAAQVSFTPVSFDWGSDEGGSASGSTWVTNWSGEGSHSVSLTVSYSVSYSLGAGWIDAGVISSSASASVQVVAAPVPVVVKSVPPLLVSGNCKVRPGSYRC